MTYQELYDKYFNDLKLKSNRFLALQDEMNDNSSVFKDIHLVPEYMEAHSRYIESLNRFNGLLAHLHKAQVLPNDIVSAY